MKYAKMLGLAVVSALAVMAFVGAGTASAVQVCVTGTADGKCAAGERELATNESVTGTSTNATLTSSITNVICSHSTTTVKMTGSNTSSPIAGEVTALKFTGCKTSGGTNCTVTEKNLPYPGSLTATSLTVQDAVGAGAQVQCGFLINCEFTVTDIALAVSNTAGGAQFLAANEKLNRNGGFCPETAEWDATYTSAGTTIL